MANKPSARTHRMRPEEGINLTPMIDMITCLMFFLMMFAGILPVVIIDAPLPKIASSADEIKQAKNEENKLEVMVYINNTGFQVKTDQGGGQSFTLDSKGRFPYEPLHKFLVQLKSQRPSTKEITLMPSDEVTYDVMIGVMDASRELLKDDRGFQTLPPDISGKPESIQFNRLFPDVSIGGV